VIAGHSEREGAPQREAKPVADSTPLPDSTPLLDRWLLPLLLSGAALAVNGYRFGTSDQSIQLTLLRERMDPGGLAGDLVADHAAEHATLLWHALAPLVRALGWERLPGIALLLYGVALLATFTAIVRMAAALHPTHRAAAILGPTLLVIYKACPAHVRTFEPELINRTVAAPLLLASMGALLRGRSGLGALLCGLAFNLHGSTAAHVAAAGFGACLLDPSLRRRLPRCGALWLLGAAPLLVTLPGVLTPTWLDSAWRAVLEARLPHHLFAARWPGGTIAVFALHMGLLGWGLCHLTPEPIRRRVAGMALGLLLCLAMGVLAPVHSVIVQLHLGYASVPLAILAYLCAAGPLARLIAARPPSPRPPLSRKALAGGALAAVLLIGPEASLIGRARPSGWQPLGPTGPDRELIEALAGPLQTAGPLLVSPAPLAWLRPQVPAPLWVSVKDGGESVFSRDFALTWAGRMTRLCGDDVLSGAPEDWRGYAEIRRRCRRAWDQGIVSPRELLRESGATLLIERANRPISGLPIRYQNECWVVYAPPRSNE